MPNKSVQVEFRRSGGLAGIDMTATVDASELPTEQVETLTELVAQPPVAAKATATHGAADHFSYEMTLRDGQRTRTLHWTDSDVPDDVRPILASLTRRAKPAPPA